MRTFIYKPQLDGVSGEIELRVPGFDDKFEFVELMAEEKDEVKAEIHESILTARRARKMDALYK